MRLTDDDHEMIERAITRYRRYSAALSDGTLYEKPERWEESHDGETVDQYDARMSDGWQQAPMDIGDRRRAERYRDEAAIDIARIVGGRALYQD